MIGVIAKPAQVPVVAEFFELFKTPWEPYRRGIAYDVVIAMAGEVPSPMPKLLISCGQGRASEESGGLGIVSRHPTGMITQDGVQLPIYVGLHTFIAVGAWTDFLRADAGIVGLRRRTGECTTLRLGYDLFDEVRFLLSPGQPVEHAALPALDLHIAMLRQWILDAGVPVVEIPPMPAGHDFAVCLTHDIDFVGIRRHFFDHTMLGFLYRSTIGAIRDVLRRRMSIGRLLRVWRAAASLPFVYLGWAKDFWEPFNWYLETEKGLPATYYLIPFRQRAGERVDSRAIARRGAPYDVTEISGSVATLTSAGCEVGVHGIDAWHNADRGRDELVRVQGVTRDNFAGIRMHWLLQNATTPAVLEQAGYSYDSTSGYNETVGYRNGTTQVFKPLSTMKLLELPMHIQDGALFYPQRLNLSEEEAAVCCEQVIDHVRRAGGVLTLLWHDRSHGPERFWGEFYRGLVQRLRASDAWFGTGSQVVGWFRSRRAVRFSRVEAAGESRVALRFEGERISPPLRVRITRPSSSTPLEVAWDGVIAVQTDPLLGFVPDRSQPLPVAASL